MYVAAFTGNELKLFNRFPVKDEQDFLKYTFAITHQLAFDRMYCRITILGDVKGINVDVDVLREYFKNIQATEPKSNQTYSPGAEIFKETHLLEAYWTLLIYGMKKVAIFPGSFDPYTNGHHDIVMRGLNLFDEIIIGIGYNSAKQNRYFDIDMMVSKIEEVYKTVPQVKVVVYNELTSTLAKKYSANFLIRGLRNTT